MSRVLVLTGGPDYAHDFGASGAALADLARRHGHAVDVVDHPDAVVDRLAAGVDALVVNALRWRMLAPAYDAWREAWAYETPAPTRAAIAGFVAGGGGLVALHTAPICFDDWPGWGDIVGGSWCWDVSAHPPLGPVRARIVGEHPVTAGLPAELCLVDEVYGDLDVRGGVEVLAVARRTADDREHPVVWAHRHGRGRVVFDGFGHDAASLRHVDHARLLAQALAWVLGPV